MARRNKAKLPQITPVKLSTLTISDFEGMNNTDHPTSLKDNVLSNLQNSYFRNNMLSRRLGTTADYGYLTGKHSEPFTAITKKDAATTTGDWGTDGTANLITNTTTAVDAAVKEYGNGSISGRTSAIASNGTIVVTYADTGGIKAQKSADNGATWTNLAGSAGETTINSDATFTSWSIWIDSSDHIHVGYTYLAAGYGSVGYRKLTYSSGSWTVGDQSSIVAGGGGVHYGFYGITATDAGAIYVAICYDEKASVLGVCKSTNGTSWTGTDGAGWTTEITRDFYNDAVLLINNSQPMVIYSESVANRVMSREFDGTNWASAVSVCSGESQFRSLSVTRKSDDNIWAVFCSTISTNVYTFNGTSWSHSLLLDSSGEPISPVITTDGTNVWVIWSFVEAYNQIEVYSTVHNGTSWGTNTNITDDNGNNRYQSVPHRVSTVFPLFWITGTSTYALKARCVQISGVIQSVGYDAAAGSQVYSAAITSTLNGGTVTAKYADSADNTTFGTFSTDIATMNKRYIKFQLTLTTTSLSTSPSVDLIEITYGGLNVVGGHSFTLSGTNYQIIIAGARAFVVDTGALLQIKSNLTVPGSLPGAPTTGAPFQNFGIICNGSDAPMRFNGKTTTGTIEVQAGTPTILRGTDTLWNTASNANQLSVGGRVKIGSTWYTIQTLTSDTLMTMTESMPTTAAGSSYEAYGLPALAGSPPVGKYVAVHNNFVFIAGVAAYPTRLYNCASGDGVTWSGSGTGFIDINTNDGEVITGIVSFKDVLAIGKYDAAGSKKSILGLYGKIFNDFTYRQLTSDFGFTDQRAVAVAPNALYFIDRSGIVETNLITFRRVDLPINGTTDTWNQATLAPTATATGAVATYWDDYCFFAIPAVGSSVNNKVLMLDLQTGRQWGIHTGLTPSCFYISPYSSVPSLYFGDQTAVSAVFRWNSGTTDNGAYIDWIVETKEFDWKSYFTKKTIKYLYAFMDNTDASYNISAYYALNGSTTWTQLSEQMAVTSTSSDNFKRWTLPGLSGSSIKFKFEENVSTSTVNLVKIAIVAIEKNLRTN